MSWVMHPDEVAVLDCNAVAIGVSITELMGAAAAALARQALQTLETFPPERAKGAVCFLCGQGNNGGDGFAAALSLRKQWQGPICVMATASRQHSQTAQKFAQEFRQYSKQNPMLELCEVGVLDASGTRAELEPGIQQKLAAASLIVDCLFGAGFSGTALRGVAAALIHLCLSMKAQGHLPPVLACDLPSGLGSEFCLPADQSLSFHAAKLPMYQESTDQEQNRTALRPEVGQLTLAPLPWPVETLNCGPGEILRFPPLHKAARKGDRGRLLIIGGGPYWGAPMLAAQAAARTACDLVHLAMPSSATLRLNWPLHIIPENLPTNASPDFFDEISSAHLLQRCQEQDFDAVLIGPGLGRKTQTIQAIWLLIQDLIGLEIPLVLDADALFVLSIKSAGVWPSSSPSQAPACTLPKPMCGILTPHSRELQRWLGNLSPQSVLQSIENSAAGLVASNCYAAEQQAILCSGSSDQITGRAGRTASAHGGSPRMACAGTGDLLAGICASLLAQGMSPWAAARLASYLMRQAGTLAATELGLGLLADDLPFYIAEALSLSYRKAHGQTQ